MPPGIIYPRTDERFREWFEQTVIRSRLKATEIADRLGINPEYVYAVLRGEASFPEELIAKFAEIYKRNPPPPAYSAYGEITQLLKNDPEAEGEVLKMLRGRERRG